MEEAPGALVPAAPAESEPPRFNAEGVDLRRHPSGIKPTLQLRPVTFFPCPSRRLVCVGSRLPAVSAVQNALCVEDPWPGQSPPPAEQRRRPARFVSLVRNMVATVNLDCKLDLKTIALHARNAEYNPKRFSAVIMRIRDPKTTALIFSSGKMAR